MDNFSKVSDILLDMAIDKHALSGCVKKAVAFGFWKNICGSRFSDFSIPYDIKGKTLLVTVKNPQVMQELIFCKSMLLPKIKDYFLPLNIQIEDIRYDYKSWNFVSKPKEFKGDESLREYREEELEEINFNKDEIKEISEITNTVSNLSFLDPIQKEKYSKNIINSLKARKLRKRDEIDRQRK